MPLAAFQTELARLITSPHFRRAVQEGGAKVLSRELTSLERRRLLSIASSPGLEVTWSLHKGFRLNKLLSRIPLTWTLLEEDVMAREISSFWEQTPPTSFYFIAEAIAFCDFLLARTREMAIPYLEEVVAFERAIMILQSPQVSETSAAQFQIVHFEHDPTQLLTALKMGMPVGDLVSHPCFLIGQLNNKGEIIWSQAGESLD